MVLRSSYAVSDVKAQDIVRGWLAAKHKVRKEVHTSVIAYIKSP